MIVNAVVGYVLLTIFGNNVHCLNLCDKNLSNVIPVPSYNASNVTTQNCGCANRQFCFRKCCKFGYFLEKRRCNYNANISRPFEIPVYKNKTIFIKTVSFSEDFLVGSLKCDYFRLDPKNIESDKFYVQNDSTLWVPGSELFYDNEKYCVENDKFGDLITFVCFPEIDITEIISHKVNAIGMIISMPFLLATFLVYLVLPERNLHMKALMFYVISLLLGYILLVYIQLSDLQLPDEVCTMLGLLVVFFFILSFLWMNVICIDIWLTFRGIKGISGSKRNAERKRLIIYCAYTWGLTLLHVLVVFIINKYAPKDSWYNPGVGFGQCFLRDGYPQLLYFYGPMGVVIICNVTLFAMTAFKIRQVKNDTKVLRSSENSSRHSKENEQKYYLYLKLLLAMGINWIMELISWVVEWKLREAPKYIWYLTDFCNAIYGVFIFFLFVFKRKIWTMLKKRYYTFMGRPHMAHGMSSQRTTQTSTYESQSTDPNLTDKSLRMESLRK